MLGYDMLLEQRRRGCSRGSSCGTTVGTVRNPRGPVEELDLPTGSVEEAC